MSSAVPPEAFTLVLISAGLHASWNAMARVVKGRMSAVLVGTVWSVAFSVCVSLIAVLVWYDIREIMARFTWRLIGTLVASAAVHSAYLFLLAIGYRIADMSVVYPISRGSGVVFGCLLGFLILGESISVGSACGIGLIVIGVVLSGLLGNTGPSIESIAARACPSLVERCGRLSYGRAYAACPRPLRCWCRTFCAHRLPATDADDLDGVEMKSVVVKSVFDDPNTPVTPARADDAPSGGSVLPAEAPGSSASPDEEQAEDDISPTIHPAPPPIPPSVSPVRVAGVSLAIGACIGTYSFLDGHMAQIIPGSVLIGPLWIIMLFFYAPPLALQKKVRDDVPRVLREHFVLTALIGVVSVGGFTIMLIAFTVGGSVALLIALREVSVAFGVVIAFTLLGESATLTRIAGVLFIITGAVCIRLFAPERALPTATVTASLSLSLLL